MPSAPPRHRVAAEKRHTLDKPKVEASRQTTRALHTGSASWRAIRKDVLYRDKHTCRGCGKLGDQVDHVNGDSHDNRPENLQTLCHSCHSAKTRAENHKVSLLPRFDYRPLMPVTVIAGPPASGKTTWARKQAGPRDLVLDLDEIKARLSGCKVHETPDDIYWRALAERNDILYSLTKRADYPHVWFVVMAPKLTERRHWRENLNAETVVLEVGPAECMRRISLDPTRTAKGKEFWERIVYQWWERYTADPGGDRVLS